MDDTPASAAGSDLSETRDGGSSPSAAEVDLFPSGPEEETPVDNASSSSDEDDEADGEYSENVSVAASPEACQSRRASDVSQSSESSSKSLKRKAEQDLALAMSLNPDLYGVRRTRRNVTNNRRIIESESEDDESDAPVSSKRRRVVAPSTHYSLAPTPRSAVQSDLDDEEDTYINSRRARLTKKQKNHQRQVAAGLAPPSLGEVRFTSRNVKKINYNETEEEDEDEDREYTYEEADTSPVIDLVLDHREKEEIATRPERRRKEDYEYRIKWQGKAHIHATWETVESIPSSRIRKIENYFLRTIQHELYVTHDPDIPREELEKYILEREREREKLEQSCLAERVIGSRWNEDGETEYFVKWREVGYDGCTWEHVDILKPIAEAEIEAYLEHAAKPATHNLTGANLPDFRHWPSGRQADYIKGGTLKDFQRFGVEWIAFNWTIHRNIILADEMGLGKTVQSVAAMYRMFKEHGQQGPYLVVAPLSTIAQWQATFDIWAPEMHYVVYLGNAAARETIHQFELFANGDPRKCRFNVVITSYEYILLEKSVLSSVRWLSLVVDEAHRLKNPEAQLYRVLMDFNIQHKLLLTGTPLQNTIPELSALLHFLHPDKFDVNNDVDITDEKEAGEKLATFISEIKNNFLRRMKDTVTNDLPKKTEKILRFVCAENQLEVYRNILTKNFEALRAGPNAPKQTFLNVMMELRKAANHLFLIAGGEEMAMGSDTSRENYFRNLITSSGKMIVLDHLLTKLKREGHRVLIFTQMVKMLDLLGQYLEFRGHNYQRLDGTMPAAARKTAIGSFNAPDSKDFCFILSTRAGGLGINLTTADIVIIFDSDFNPQMDIQAMSRAHRIGQTKPVTVFRLVMEKTVEEDILERSEQKLMLEEAIIKEGITDKKAQKYSRDAAKKGLTDAPTTAEALNNLLKRRGQGIFAQKGNQKRLDEIDIDAVIETAEVKNTAQQTKADMSVGGDDFMRSLEITDIKIDDLSWDDIIPKEEVEKIRAQEKEREQKAFLLKMIAENQPRKAKLMAGEGGRSAKKEAQKAMKKRHDDDSDLSETERPKKKTKKAAVARNDELGETEIRNLLKAYGVFGYFEDCQDQIIKFAELEAFDPALLKKTLDMISERARKILQARDEWVKETEDKENKVLTKKAIKAAMFSYGNIKQINAEKFLERPEELRMLRQYVNACPHPKDFRFPKSAWDKLSKAEYSTEWGEREDAMLAVGICRYGLGEWRQIQNDPELGLQEHLFLDEQKVASKRERENNVADGKAKAKTPGPVHLVRRAEGFFKVLKLHKEEQEGGPKKEGDQPAMTRKPSQKHIRRAMKDSGSRSRGHSQSEARDLPDRRADGTPTASNKSPKNEDGKAGQGSVDMGAQATPDRGTDQDEANRASAASPVASAEPKPKVRKYISGPPPEWTSLPSFKRENRSTNGHSSNHAGGVEMRRTDSYGSTDSHRKRGVDEDGYDYRDHRDSRHGDKRSRHYERGEERDYKRKSEYEDDREFKRRRPSNDHVDRYRPELSHSRRSSSENGSERGEIGRHYDRPESRGHYRDQQLHYRRPSNGHRDDRRAPPSRYDQGSPANGTPHRPSASRSGEPHRDKDKQMRQILSSVFIKLEILRTAKPANYPDPAKRVAAIKENIQEIGDFISKLPRDDARVEVDDVWEFAARYLPFPPEKQTAKTMRDYYQKLRVQASKPRS